MQSCCPSFSAPILSLTCFHLPTQPFFPFLSLQGHPKFPYWPKYPWPCLDPLTTWFLCGMVLLTALSLKFSLSLLRQTPLVTYLIPIFPFCPIKRIQFCLGLKRTHLKLLSSVSLPRKGGHVTQFSSVTCRWKLLVELLHKLFKGANSASTNMCSSLLPS